MSTRGALLSLLALFLVPALFVFLVSDTTQCHIDNLRDGYFWTPSFASDVVISGNEGAKRLDFSKLQQFRHICVGYLYAPGFPQGTRWMMDNVKRSGPRACWREGENFLTVGGVSESGVATWTKITLSGPAQWYQMEGESCAETRHAVIHCQNDRCRWDQQQP